MRYDRLLEETRANKSLCDLANEEVAKLSHTLAQLRSDIASLQQYVSTKM